MKVCIGAFHSIFAVSEGRINRALKAQSAASGAPHTDRRGRHEPINKITEEREGFVRQHIEATTLGRIIQTVVTFHNLLASQRCVNCAK